MLSSEVKVAIGRRIVTWFPRLWMERELRFRPHHFERELWLLPIFCDKGSTAIDVGANEGTYSYYMKKFSGKVIAFEPNTDLWRHLRRLLGPDVDLEAAALSGKSSRATLRVNPMNTGVSTIEEMNDLSFEKDKQAIVSREVETRTLDSYNLTGISVVKIDVEGHEEAVIEGARETIQRNRPVFIIESEDRHNFGAPCRLAQTFGKLEYTVFYIKDGHLSEFDTLRKEDTDPKNLSADGSSYINNFIFIPAEQGAKIEHAQVLLSAR
jgi:FkbM family methyltransferase